MIMLSVIVLHFSSLTLAWSFKNTRTWVQSIHKIKSATLPKILVGNKLDMKEERVVDTETARELAEEFGVKYFETSALSGDGIADMMDNIMSQVYEYKVVPEMKAAANNP